MAAETGAGVVEVVEGPADAKLKAPNENPAGVVSVTRELAGAGVAGAIIDVGGVVEEPAALELKPPNENTLEGIPAAVA